MYSISQHVFTPAWSASYSFAGPCPVSSRDALISIPSDPTKQTPGRRIPAYVMVYTETDRQRRYLGE